MAISFPAASLVHHDTSERIQNNLRIEVLSKSAKLKMNTLNSSEARFPFKVFEILLHESSFKFALLCFGIWSIAPLLLLTKIRNTKNFEYLSNVQKIQKEMAERDFYEQLIESQNIINRKFNGAFDLKEKLIYENPPFNTQLKIPSKLIFFNSQAFNIYLNTLKK